MANSGNGFHQSNGTASKDKAGDAPVRGMLLAISGLVLLPVMDAIAKYLGQAGELSPGTITLARFAIQLSIAFLWIVLFGGGFSSLKPRHFWMNFLRGVLVALASLLFFTAVKYMPLADAIAIFFVEPLILTLLSVVILRESVGWRRILAIVAGFVGALIVVQPSFGIFGFVSLLPLATATLFSFYLLLNRIAGQSDDAWVMQFVSGIGGVSVLCVALMFGQFTGIGDLAFTPFPVLQFWPLLLLMGLVGLFGHFLVVRAFQMAPASVLAPFQYVEIISAVVLGYVLFSDFPSLSKWVGIAIIVASGLFVFWREQRKQKAAY